MSAEAIHLLSTNLSVRPDEVSRTMNLIDGNYNVSNTLPFQLLCKAYFEPEPTPEQVALEEFLLECD
jgi:hypothetical protein